ncbi:hypothetical protein [Chamaesiphon sp. VAR_69_metabat_338]|uniref:hypothetical protein n=1 Tax=Chamaesiphon sp. VAR_69_metabat_338 TaxID=2964704 RepID=UPI00286DD156|nr:hypothetical protein [Chamaesiphon sp. VAR_69_metabat_338]
MSFLKYSLLLADVSLPAGATRNFQYCVKITNLNKYPNYLLFARVNSPTASPSAYIQIQANRCQPVDGYRPSLTIQAIAKNRVKTSDLQKIGNGIALKNPQLQKSLIVGTPTIGRPYMVPMINEGRKVEAGFEIESISPQGLTLIRVPEAKPVLNLLLFPAIGMAILGWIVWKRQQKTVG